MGFNITLAQLAIGLIKKLTILLFTANLIVPIKS